MRLLGEGRPLGVHAVATADRYGAVPTAVSANVTKRIVLRMSDEGAYSILGAPKDVLNERSAPGRAIVDGFETQVAAIGGTANVAEQTAGHAAVRRGTPRVRRRRGIRDRGAAHQPVARQMPDRVDESPVLGVSDDVLGPKGFEPVGTFVVAGPPRSGKSAAVRSIISSIGRFDPGAEFFHFGGRRAVLRDSRAWTARGGHHRGRAIARQGAHRDRRRRAVPGSFVIVVENVTEYSDTDAERPLKELFQAVNRSEHFLVGDGDISQLSSGYGLIGELKGGRRGIALEPDTYDGESLFKVPFPRCTPRVPRGRGIFVENGRDVAVQLPWHGDARGESSPFDGRRIAPIT